MKKPDLHTHSDRLVAGLIVAAVWISAHVFYWISTGHITFGFWRH